MMSKCCANCRHYSEDYCSLMDELVNECDCCGMCDNEML